MCSGAIWQECAGWRGRCVDGCGGGAVHGVLSSWEQSVKTQAACRRWDRGFECLLPGLEASLGGVAAYPLGHYPGEPSNCRSMQPDGKWPRAKYLTIPHNHEHIRDRPLRPCQDAPVRRCR